MDQQIQQKLMDAALEGLDPEMDQELKCLIKNNPEHLNYWNEMRQVVAGLNHPSMLKNNASLPADFHENLQRAIKSSNPKRPSEFNETMVGNTWISTFRDRVLRLPRLAFVSTIMLGAFLIIQHFKPSNLERSNLISRIQPASSLQLSMGRMALESEVKFNQLLSTQNERKNKKTQAKSLRMLDSRNLELLNFQ